MLADPPRSRIASSVDHINSWYFGSPGSELTAPPCLFKTDSPPNSRTPDHPQFPLIVPDYPGLDHSRLSIRKPPHAGGAKPPGYAAVSSKTITFSSLRSSAVEIACTVP